MLSLRPDELNCNACSGKLCLVAQVYAPILCGPLKIEERTIYIFCCTMPNCGTSPHSWRVLRIQNSYMGGKLSRIQDVLPSTASFVSNSKTDWRDNLWSMNTSKGERNPDGDCMDLLDLGRVLPDEASSGSSKKNNRTKMKSANFCQDTISPSLNLNMPDRKEEASLSKDSRVYLSESSASMKENESDCCDDDWEEELYEYDQALNADRGYLKFKKQMDVYPEQCFRYSHGSKPLLASEMAGGKAGKCMVCGACRRFEMQLMPALLYFLHEAATESQKQLLQNWDWLTVLVYTCSENCFQGVGEWSVAEEAVLIQSENPIPWPVTAAAHTTKS